MKPVYVPSVAEAVLARDRRPVWEAVLGQVGGVTTVGDTRTRTLAGVTIVERAISVEPPWRLVFDAVDPPTGFHQETVVLVPHRAGCLAVWAALVLDPIDDAGRHYQAAVSQALPAQLDALVSTIAGPMG